MHLSRIVRLNASSHLCIKARKNCPAFHNYEDQGRNFSRSVSHARRCVKSKRRKVLRWKFFSIRFIHSWAAQLCEEGKVSELFSPATLIVIHKIWIMYKAATRKSSDVWRHRRLFFLCFQHDVHNEKSNKRKSFLYFHLFLVFLPLSLKSEKNSSQRKIYYVNNRYKHKSFEHLSWTSMNLFQFFSYVLSYIIDRIITL